MKLSYKNGIHSLNLKVKIKKSKSRVIFITIWINYVQILQSEVILSPSEAKISEDLQMNKVEYPIYSI